MYVYAHICVHIRVCIIYVYLYLGCGLACIHRLLWGMWLLGCLAQPVICVNQYILSVYLWTFVLVF